MGSPAIFKGSNVKLLKDNIEFFSTAGGSNVKYITGVATDPSSVATEGGAGSILTNTSGEAYLKLDNGLTTNWSRMGSFFVGENDFSAVITNNGTAAITSQTSDFIQSVSRTALGRVQVTFKAGFFTVKPSVIAGNLNNGDTQNFVTAVHTNATYDNTVVTIETKNSSGYADQNFNIQVSRQGSDYIQSIPTSTALEEIVTTTSNGSSFNIRLHSTTLINSASNAVTYSAANGTYTALKSGFYFMGFDWTNDVTNSRGGISLNAAGSIDANGTGADNRGTSIQSIASAQRLGMAANNDPNGRGTNISVIRKLNAGDVVRLHTDGNNGNPGTTTDSLFTMAYLPLASGQSNLGTTAHLYGTTSGTFTSGAWQTRALTVEDDPDGIVTLSANQFTLNAGTYLIDASAPAFEVDSHQVRLRNTTDGTTDIIGSSSFARSSGSTYSNRSHLSGRVTIVGTKVFELQHRCTTTRASIGFGITTGFGDGERFGIVKITKIA